MKIHNSNTRITYTLNSTYPTLGYIGVSIGHLPWSLCKSYQVLLPTRVLQLVEGTNIEGHTQEHLLHQFQVCRVTDTVSHLTRLQTPSKFYFYLTLAFYQHYQLRHDSILFLFLTRLWNRPPIAPFQHWRLNIGSVVLGCHI